jgi:hypothetical protein
VGIASRAKSPAGSMRPTSNGSAYFTEATLDARHAGAFAGARVVRSRNDCH